MVQGEPTVLSRRFQKAAPVASLVAAGLSLCVLTAWATERVGRFLPPAWYNMMPGSALCVLLSAAAVWLMRVEKAETKVLLARLLGITVMIVSGLALVEYSLGLDVALGPYIYQLVTGMPGGDDVQMSLPTAVGLFGLGTAILLTDTRPPNAHCPGQWLCLVPIVVTTLALVGHAYSVRSLYQFQRQVIISIPTAVCVLVLSLGLATVRPDRHPVKLLASNHLGGYIARRLIPAAVLFPVLVGSLRMLGQEAGWYGVEMGNAIDAVANILFFSVLIATVARTVAALEAQRRSATEAVRRSEAHLRHVLDNLFAFVGVLEPSGTVLMANRAPLEAAGLRRDDVVGRKFWDCPWWTHDSAQQARVRDACARAAHGQISRYDAVVRMADDSRMTIDFQIAPLRDEQGRITHLLPSATDITARKVAEDSVRRAHALLDGIARGTDDRIAAFDQEGRFILFNRSYEAEFRTLFGRQVALGEKLERALADNPTEAAAAMDMLAQGLSGRRFTTVREITNPEGSSRWFDVGVSPIFDPTGAIGGVALIVRDVTASKTAEHSLRVAKEAADRQRAEQEAIVNSMAEGVAVCDVRGNILTMNPAALAIHGVRSLDQLKRRLDEFPDLLELRDRHGRPMPVEQWPLSRALRGETFTGCELQVVGRRGLRTFTAAYAGAPVRNPAGEIILGVATLRDITRQRETEQALAEARIQLEFRAHELERAVEDRTARLRESVHELERFSYSLSHDLRAPLRAMKGFSQILQMEYGEKLVGDGAMYLQKISAAAGRLDQLIQDVLTYSQIVREQIRLGPVDVGQLVRQIVDENPALQPPNAEVVMVAPLEPVLGHEAYLTQVLSNLIYNGVKFVAPGTRPQVRLWTEARNGDVCLYIRDNGIGIPEHARRRIFGMFERLNPDYEGTGIGLTIVQKAVERMGGAIGLQSEEGRGTTFWIKLRKPPNES